MADLHPLQFRHHMPTEKYHHVDAYSSGGEKVGSMRWAAQRTSAGPAGEIVELRTNPEARRQGVATGMFGYGQSFDVAPKHSSSRTPEGNAFAKSTGTAMPKWRKKLPSEDM